MEKNNEKKSNTGFIIFMIIFVGILWGLPSLINGKGFFEGIFDNIRALFWLLGLAIVVVVIFKITEK